MSGPWGYWELTLGGIKGHWTKLVASRIEPMPLHYILGHGGSARPY